MALETISACSGGADQSSSGLEETSDGSCSVCTINQGPSRSPISACTGSGPQGDGQGVGFREKALFQNFSVTENAPLLENALFQNVSVTKNAPLLEKGFISKRLG